MVGTARLAGDSDRHLGGRARTCPCGFRFASAVTWLRIDLGRTPIQGSFDLVSVFYFPMARSDTTTPRRLVDAVAPGGRLLFVSHEMDALRHHGHIDPDDYWQPADIAALLDTSWTVEVHETRPRPPVGAPDAPHVEDVVLVARRR